MKTTIAVCCAAILLFVAAFNASADIIAGPIKNPANGHKYFLLSPNSWTASEAEAENLGGTLAIIRNADEQKWVFSTFSTNGGVNNHLWIGLYRPYPGGPFGWVTGAKLDYTYWCKGQPDNGGGVESYVHMCAPNRPFGQPLLGGWNDLADTGSVDGYVPNGVVEIGDKPKENALTEKETSLIGTWYETGKLERPCWIAGTGHSLFVIPNTRFATRVGICDDGSILEKQWPMAGRIYTGFSDFGSMPGQNSQRTMRGEIVKDRILWNNGTWWSRKPVGYEDK